MTRAKLLADMAKAIHASLKDEDEALPTRPSGSRPLSTAASRQLQLASRRSRNVNTQAGDGTGGSQPPVLMPPPPRRGMPVLTAAVLVPSTLLVGLFVGRKLPK